MATVTDRPERKRQRSGEQAPPPESPSPAGPRRRSRDLPPPRATPRWVGGVYLLAPLAAVLAGVLAIAAVVLAIALNVGSGPSPPATGAATLVPSDALLYLHVSTDSSRPGVGQALAHIERLPGAPLLIGAVTARLDAILSGSGPVEFATDVRPWLGREAAFAVLDTSGGSAGSLVVLDVRNRARAQAFLAAHGAVSAGSYRRVALLQETTGTTLAFLGHYLVFGQASSVQAAIDVARGARSLAQSPTYQRVAADEPVARVLDFYAPAAGVTRALLPSGGLLGALGVLLDQRGLSAATVAVSPTDTGFDVQVKSTLDPRLTHSAAAGARTITPSLAAALPAGSTMLLDAADLRGAAGKLLAAAGRVGIAGRAADLLTRLGSALVSEGVSVRRLFAIFGPEAALAIVPGTHGGGPAPVLVGRNSHPSAALRELSNLEGPLTEAFTPPSSSAGVVPEVGATKVGGVTISQMTLAPGLELGWAVSHGLVVLSTSANAIARIIRHATALSGERSYENTVGALPGPATSLLFFDPGPLLRLASRIGLIGGDVLPGLLPDLEQIRAIALASRTGDSQTTTQLQLQIR